MFRFIRMWLVLRVLQHQEDYIVRQDGVGEMYLTEGARMFSEKAKFIQVCSNFHTGLAFLPRIFRSSLNPLDIRKDIVKKPINHKIRDLDSIIREAMDLGYIETPKQVGKRAVDLNKEACDHIGISPKGDNFVTYWGGVEALISRYPKAWAFLILTLSPSWFPLVVKYIAPVICSYIPTLGSCK